jgi:hypothetical protein
MKGNYIKENVINVEKYLFQCFRQNLNEKYIVLIVGGRTMTEISMEER